MKLLKKLIGVVYLIHLFNYSGMTQDYLWPTDASHYLTSSFAEYRPGHFHAGIDIKTWSRIGYKVFAIRDGYIMRIGISPYGYGKVLYQKLDSGEIVVYAHLDRFNDELQNYIKQEQKRKRAYRINNYLGRDQFPIKKGDIIGYTGASGIGSPHLHFEIRDANNNPINPFLLGYRVEDSVPPTVRAISFTPMNFYSRVNADVIPSIEKPTLINKGKYKLDSRPFLSGHIGVAVDCFDQANGVNHSFAVYKLDFYVDGELYFSAKYDKFSYAVSSLIDLDRDFRLMSRGVGRFQKLYKEQSNQLPFYKPMGNEIGIIRCNTNSKNIFIVPDGVGKGLHQFNIELYDFFGNMTTIVGNFIVGEREMIYADFELQEPDRLLISNIVDQNGIRIENPEIFVSLNQGISWRKMAVQPIDEDTNVESPAIIKYLLTPVQPGMILKIQSVDDDGVESFPLYKLIEGSTLTENLMTDISLEKDFYDDYIRLTLKVDGLIGSTPKLSVQQIGIPATEVPLWQNRFNEIIGVYPLMPGKDGPLSIEANANDLSGRELTYWEQMDIRTVFPHRGGSIISKDGNCRVVFNSESVYKNLFLRIESIGPLDDSAYDFVGEAYEIYPQDIPLKRSAKIELNYPNIDPSPSKLGIYQINRTRPGFRGNNLNLQKSSISCNISNLGAFTILRDTIPPVVEIRHPANNAQLSDKKPTLIAVVYDALSGIANERSIVMRLDGAKVIAEYDPDARTINYELEEALLSGEHVVSIWAVDNCKNEILVSHKFYISQ